VLPRTARAVIIPAPHAPPTVIERPIPELEPGAALLRTLVSEVCGTDVHLHHGRLSGVPYPLTPGHVSVGQIAAIRGSIADVDGRPFREGDLVTFLDVHETCHRCYQCLVARQSTRCPFRKVYGITYGANDGLLGGWSEYIWMKPGVRLLRLTDGLAPETFIGGGCGLVTALHAVDRAEIRLGQSVAVLGAGPVGQSITALASRSGASDVIVVGGPDDRLAFARRMGATATLGLHLPDAERTEKIRQITGGHGVDAVIEASGSPDAIPQGLDLLRDGGRMVVCGHYTDNGPVSVHPHHQINRKHVEIRGCWGSDYSHFHRAVRLAARLEGLVPWRDMASRTFCLDEAGSALAAVESRSVLKALIDPWR
jgi:threonine dehydrogenase-like Zn-dependent dehydrogenase